MKKFYILLISIIVTVVTVFLLPVLDISWLGSLNWSVIAAILAILICAALFFKFEAKVTSSKEIAMIAMLGTASAVLRIPFAAVPSVQPCTYLIICAGYVFGPIAGFAIGAITPLASNFFLGHGPWTLYQMIAWGLAGLSAGFFSKFKPHILLVIAFGVIWGYLYGLITNLWFWLSFVYPLTWKTLFVTQMNAVWLDTFHAAGNAVFLGTLGMKTIAVLGRFKRRFSITIHNMNSISVI